MLVFSRYVFLSALLLAKAAAGVSNLPVFVYFDRDEAGPQRYSSIELYREPKINSILIKSPYKSKPIYNFYPVELEQWPTHIRVEWMDAVQQHRYEAIIELPSNFNELVASLPTEVQLYSQKEPIKAFIGIVVNLTNNNKAEISLINAAEGINIKSRKVIEVVKDQQGVLIEDYSNDTGCGC